MSGPSAKPCVLCVDDEPEVLEGLKLHLRRRYDVHGFTSGAAALESLAGRGEVAAIVSDMRMPGLDGVAFLARAKAAWPHTSRILLTGQADLRAAIAAVNEGAVFRFLQKPTPPDTLLAVVAAAVEQHRLVTAEQVLLAQTLQGSIKALCDVLALAQPLAFGRASRVKELVSAVAARLELGQRWQVEVAAMLLHVGMVVLPDEVAEKLHEGRALTPAEEAAVHAVPGAAERLLSAIPRLEAVRTLIALSQSPTVATTPGLDAELRTAGCVLRACLEYDRLTTTGVEKDVAYGELLGRSAELTAPVVTALAEVVRTRQAVVHELRVEALRPGMVFVEDVRMMSGSLLVPRGFAVTPTFLERIRSYQPGVVREPLRVRGAD